MTQTGRAVRLRAGAALLALLSGGCVTVRAPGFMRSSAERGWPATLQNAQMDAASGRFAAADSTLVMFARQHSGSSEAMEAHYWLALYALDPDNKGASLDQATDELSTYLAASGERKHVAEAASLSRVAVALRSLTQQANAAASRARASGAAAAAANARAADATASDNADHPDTSTSSDAEVKRLREQLAKANAELERIRKRLTTGGKPPR